MDEKAQKFLLDWSKLDLEPGDIISTSAGAFLLTYSEDEFIHHRYYSLVALSDGREYGSLDDLDKLGQLLLNKLDEIPKIFDLLIFDIEGENYE